jgi:hypothetical protein
MVTTFYVHKEEHKIIVIFELDVSIFYLIYSIISDVDRIIMHFSYMIAACLYVWI